MRRLAIPGILAILIHPMTSARADSPQSVDFYLPGFVEDTSTADPGQLELQLGTRFQQFRHGAGHSWTLAPNANIGVTKNLEVSLGGAYTLGTTEEANTGSGSVGVMYRFNDQTTWLPSLALEAEYGAPVGLGPKTDQTTLRGVATKWLGISEHAPRLDLNLSWYHDVSQIAGNRRDLFDIGVAFTQEIRSDLALVTELYRAQREIRGQAETIADVGLLWQPNSDLTLGASVGAGIGRYSPAFEVTFGVQRSFNLF